MYGLTKPFEGQNHPDSPPSTTIAILLSSLFRFGGETVFVKEGGLKYGVFDIYQSRSWSIAGEASL